MLESILKDLLTFTQLLLIPALALMYKHLKRQVVIDSNIRDLKVYVKAICAELKIPCALDGK